MVLIRDLARRVARYEWIERRLFEVVGAWSTDDRHPDAVSVFAAEARHHAWRAGMWGELRPVLHDVDPATLEPPPPAIEAFDALASIPDTLERSTSLAEVVLPNVDRCYEQDLAGATLVADAPVIRALTLVSVDAKQDWRAAAQLHRSVVRTEEDNDRAAAHQSWLEVLLLPCWEP